MSKNMDNNNNNSNQIDIDNDDTQVKSNQNDIKHGQYTSAVGRNNQCTAHSKRTGERCKAYAVPGYDKCWRHGVGGKMSKNRIQHDLVASGVNLKDRISEIANDPNILNLSNQVAALKVIFDEMVNKLDHENKSITDPECMQQLNYISQNMARIAMIMSNIERNKSGSLDLKRYAAIIMQIKVNFINSTNQIELPQDQAKKLIDSFVSGLDQIEITGNQ